MPEKSVVCDINPKPVLMDTSATLSNKGTPFLDGVPLKRSKLSADTEIKTICDSDDHCFRIISTPNKGKVGDDSVSITTDKIINFASNNKDILKSVTDRFTAIDMTGKADKDKPFDIKTLKVDYSKPVVVYNLDPEVDIGQTNCVYLDFDYPEALDLSLTYQSCSNTLIIANKAYRFIDFTISGTFKFIKDYVFAQIYRLQAFKTYRGRRAKIEEGNGLSIYVDVDSV